MTFSVNSGVSDNMKSRFTAGAGASIFAVISLAFILSVGTVVTSCGRNDACNFKITTDSLPSGKVNIYYEFNLDWDSDCWWKNNMNNVQWTLTSGGLPPGVSFNDKGELRGTPTTAGTTTFTVQAKYPSTGDTTSKGFSLKIE